MRVIVIFAKCAKRRRQKFADLYLGNGLRDHAPFKIIPQYPPPRLGGDLNLKNLKCLTCGESQLVKSPPSPYP